MNPARMTGPGPGLQLDILDRRILQGLQSDGRVSGRELAAPLELSASAALRLVRRLEEAGVIAGCVALLAPECLGLGLTV